MSSEYENEVNKNSRELVEELYREGNPLIIKKKDDTEWYYWDIPKNMCADWSFDWIHYDYKIIVPSEVVFYKPFFHKEKKDSEKFTKADNGKLQWNLMPFEQLEDVVRVLMKGAETYSKDNWKKCDDTTRYVDALERHVVAYMKGEKIDDKAKGGDGLPHLAHAICNCLFLMWFDKQENF